MKDAQVGFNTNVVYQGQTLHIQTEDSGRGHPHVITHLYLGGSIVATKRTSYEPVEGELDLRTRVRDQMKAQHKAMILELRAGMHDEALRRQGEAVAAEPDAVPRPAMPPPEAALPPAGPPPAARRPVATPSVGTTADRTAARASYRPPARPPGEPDVVTPSAPSARPAPPAPAAGARRSGALRPAARREREGFGKDLISDRSLDEVVLSYLAEELTKEEK